VTRGAAIIREGDTDRTLYLLRYGEVSVYKQVGGGRELLGSIEAVNFVGEMSLFNDDPRSATVEAHSDEILVYAITHPDLHTILSRPRWAELLTSRLSRNLAVTNEQVRAATLMISQLKEEHSQLQARQEETAAKAGLVFAAVMKLQEVIAQESVMGSRAWSYLKVLNEVTGALLQRYLPEIVAMRSGAKATPPRKTGPLGTGPLSAGLAFGANEKAALLECLAKAHQENPEKIIAELRKMIE
jgi:CRP-like cAMP-binding protein